MVAQRKWLDSSFGMSVQRKGMLKEGKLQMKAKSAVLQRQGLEEEKELLQGKFESVQRQPDEPPWDTLANWVADEEYLVSADFLFLPYASYEKMVL